MVLKAAAVFAVGLTLSSLPIASAQIRASERGSVSQTVDGTVITVDYARPQLRGRDSVFGKVVRATHTWTPGANWATTIEVNRPVQLNGREVPAGKYSVWIMAAPGEWTINLHQNPRLFHTQHPKAEEMFLALKVAPQWSEEPVEVLTFDFPRVARDGATLRMRWSTAVLPLEIAVQSSRAAVASRGLELAPYLGSYTVTTEVEGKTIEMKAELIDSNGSLRAVMDGAWGSFTMEFIPTDKPHQFVPAFMEGGKVVDVEETPVIFDLEASRATGFIVMGIGQNIWMRGKRKS